MAPRLTIRMPSPTNPRLSQTSTRPLGFERLAGKAVEEVVSIIFLRSFLEIFINGSRIPGIPETDPGRDAVAKPTPGLVRAGDAENAASRRHSRSAPTIGAQTRPTPSRSGIAIGRWQLQSAGSEKPI